jgi:molybdate transport system regulatory protein
MAAKKGTLKLEIDGRIWINSTKGKLVGKGRIELLEKIQKLGSIRQAALAMKMSYRQAWQLIDEMNNNAKVPLVISTRGGKGGGNAIVTEKGEEIINVFNSLSVRFHKFLAQQTEKIIF